MIRIDRTLIVFLGAWPLYYAIVTVVAGPPSGAWIWTLLIPILAAFAGWALLKPLGERFQPAMPTLLLLSGGLGLLDQGVKLFVQALLGWERAVPVIRDAFELRISPNYHGSYIASLLDVKLPPWVYLLVYPVIAWITFSAMGFYASRNGSTGWLAWARVFLTAGLISAIADRLFWGFTLDWLVVYGLFACDLKDLFLNLAVLSCLSDLVANPACELRLTHGLRGDLELAKEFGRYLVGRRGHR